MKKTILISIIISLNIISCKQKNTPASTTLPTETIDFFSYKTINTNIPDSLIINRRYVKIDPGNEKLQFGTIENIKIVNDHIYILDWDLRSLTVYDMQGKGIGKVGEPGQGPGEYLQITDFDVDKTGNVYIWDGQGKHLYLYNKDFKFINSVKPAFDIDLIRCLPNGNFMFCLATWNTGAYTGSKILITDDQLNVLDKHMQYDEFVDNAYLISGNSMIQSDQHITFNQVNHNHAYIFSLEGKPEKTYTFNFDSKNVPDQDKKNVTENLAKYSNYCVLKDFTAITDKYILGTVWLGRNTKPFLINRTANEMYLGETIDDDDLSLLTNYSENTIISFIPPGENNNFQTAHLPEDIIAHLENGNYVVCLYELK